MPLTKKGVVMFLSKVLGERRRVSRRRPSRPRRSWGRFSLEPCEDRTLLSLSFAPPITLPIPAGVGGGARSILTADVGNGHQDIVVLGSPTGSSSSVSVLLGNGNGTFRPAITTHLPVQANSLAVGDFNHDGKLDLVFTNSSNNTVEVLRGNGDGTFQSNPLILPVGAGPTSVAVGDFQHDGKLGLAVTNSGSNTVSVLLGNGDGTFHAARNIAVGTVPTSVAAVDLGNGQVDLVVTNLVSNNVSVLLGNGDGTFRSGQTIAAANASNVAVGDFNGDGKPDVFVEEITQGD